MVFLVKENDKSSRKRSLTIEFLTFILLLGFRTDQFYDENPKCARNDRFGDEFID